MASSPSEPTSASTSDRDGLAVLVMARAPRGGLVLRGLEPTLGRDGCVRVQRALVARAARWAAASAARAYVAYTPSDARDEIAALVPDGVELFAQGRGTVGERLERAFGRVAAEHGGGPVVVVGDDQPALSAAHTWALADDLAAGVDVTLGPSTDGGYYLLAARAHHPELFAIELDAWGGPRVMEQTLEAALGAGLSVGWLRSERPLAAPGDVAALLADPCAPSDIAAALRG